jgi:hypothetical protein
MQRFTVPARLSSNSNQTVVGDGPVRLRLASNSNQTVVGD